MSNRRSSIAVFLCLTYLLLASALPLIGIHHALAINGESTSHEAVDACTWIQDAIGSSVFAVLDTDPFVLAVRRSDPQPSNRLFALDSLESIKARAPPVPVS